jgi:pyruvate kinase
VGPDGPALSDARRRRARSAACSWISRARRFGPGRSSRRTPHRERGSRSEDDTGRVKAPARVVVCRASAPTAEGAGPFLVLADPSAFAKVREGDELRFRDARDKKRTCDSTRGRRTTRSSASRPSVPTCSTAHEPALPRGRSTSASRHASKSAARRCAAIDVKAGDPLVLTRRAIEGRPPRRNREGAVTQSGVIACTLPAALDHLEVGPPRAVRRRTDSHRRRAGQEQTRRLFASRGQTQKDIGKLSAEKGINLPDTRTTVPSLTDDDRRALAFVAKHADAVGLSFVRTPDDVRTLCTRSSIGSGDPASESSSRSRRARASRTCRACCSKVFDGRRWPS